MLRVVLDANVVVSGLAYPASLPGFILNAWHHGNVDVVLSRYILDEIGRVLPRLKRIHLRTSEIRDLTDSLMFMAEVVDPDSVRDPELRDRSDQLVPATFRAAQAQYLITGDKDLLALAHKYPILSPADFWSRHAG
jgi:uncharacterized protein